MRRLATLVALEGTIVLLSVTAAAGAPLRDTLVRPGVGIGKVRLGMTIGEARRALGQPLVFVRARRFRAADRRFIAYRTRDAVWRVAVFGVPGHERVAQIRTSARHERTRNGVGVGTPVRELPERLRSLRPVCRTGAVTLNWQTVEKQLVACSFADAEGDLTVFAGLPTCSVTPIRYQGCPDAKIRVAVAYVIVESRILRTYELSYWWRY